MTELLTETVPQIVSQLSALAYLLVFLGGVLTSLGPCNLSMVPVIIGYVGGQHDLTRDKGFRLSLFFTLGSSLTFMLLGLIAATIGGIFGTESKILHWFVALVCFIIGLSLLGVFKINFDFLTRLQPKRVAITGLIGAFALGMVIGLAGSQCGTPVLVAILSIVMAKGKTAYGATLLFTYGLGRGVPIVLAGTFTGVVKALPAMERWTRGMEYAAGIVLIAVGLYFVWMA
ncbi:MAG: cytochrome c biogenesis protein CcdA [Armatimonadetes bacterium]|nr:cytochrome c biogenesis protein CcdA [Armatimonadota bacterium]NIM22954.1 cytochrome c biogenesis protein CcdA [Armatimonadota bacterium]NIM66825.1 cytochrome c biogenesis protein CcdA [Armatimonadota bacterium]NIM75366.1 cytochrome c biogenesis protein CcdA [Armatimonadota bacterium]NIN05013.1 cytochrome c biogenesis protein CcdA [Armatimonadota bacterium]